MGDLGYVGLLLFLALMASAYITRWQINDLVKRTSSSNTWASDLSTAITLSLVAYMAGGAGVSLGYFELVYLQIVMLAIIRQLLLRQVEQEKAVLIHARTSAGGQRA
jgi:hypothetical protein